MNTLQHLDKVLRKHHARLRIDPRHDIHEIVLSVPARPPRQPNSERPHWPQSHCLTSQR